jgi:hypothetical protein
MVNVAIDEKQSGLTQLASCSSAAQQCVGADGTEVIGQSSELSAAAQLHRWAEGDEIVWITPRGIELLKRLKHNPNFNA